MVEQQYKLPFKKGQSEVDVIFTSCWHIGNPESRIQKIKDMLKLNRPWVMLGDIIEAIMPIDPRYHAETHTETILAQAEYAASLICEAKDTLIGLHIGNHEDKVSSKVGDLTRLILDKVYHKDKLAKELKWMGGTCRTILKAPGGECVCLTAHSRIGFSGTGSGQPDRDELNRQVKLRRMLGDWKADLKVVGHGHRSVIAPPVKITQLTIHGEETQFVNSEWVAMCPSLFGQYDISNRYPSYSELAMYRPTSIGWLVATINRNGKVLNVRQEG